MCLLVFVFILSTNYYSYLNRQLGQRHPGESVFCKGSIDGASCHGGF
jgi:hypothetical protein